MNGAMSAARRKTGSWPRRLPMLAAFLALVLQLMFPAGFMAAEPGQAHGLPIVICTGQGQTVAVWDGLAGHRKSPARSMAACPFAGHAVASGPPAPAAMPTAAPFAAMPAPGRAGGVFPGRGLAAPPPPATGPPISA
jgi:hypothetical protein